MSTNLPHCTTCSQPVGKYAVSMPTLDEKKRLRCVACAAKDPYMQGLEEGMKLWNDKEKSFITSETYQLGYSAGLKDAIHEINHTQRALARRKGQHLDDGTLVVCLSFLDMCIEDIEKLKR